MDGFFYFRQMKWISKKFEELNTKELYQLMMLRQEVFVVEQTCFYQDADGKDEQAIHQWAVDEEGEMVAYQRILPPGISYKEVSIGRIATKMKIRGKGYGRPLVQKALEYIEKEFGNVDVRISAQTHLKPFYESLGFVFTGKDYLEDDIPHSEMLYKVK